MPKQKPRALFCTIVIENNFIAQPFEWSLLTCAHTESLWKKKMAFIPDKRLFSAIFISSTHILAKDMFSVTLSHFVQVYTINRLNRTTPS